MSVAIDHNPMLAKLSAGERAFGTFIFSPDPAVTELVGHAGFDFAVIDMEHATTDIGRLPDHGRAAAASGMSWWARVGKVDPVLIGRTLDAGAQGIILPHFGVDRAAGKEACRMMRYAPQGTRPSCTATRATNFGLADFEEFTRSSNHDVLSVGLIEDKCSVEAIDDILAESEVDVIIPGGQGDLATSLGVHGQGTHPLVIDAVQKVHAAARRHGKVRIGAYVSDAKGLKAFGDWEFDFYIYSVDYRVMAQAYAAGLKTLQA